MTTEIVARAQTADRAPPRDDGLADIESEQALLGLLLCDERVWADVVEILSARDFSEPLHQALYDEIGARLTARLPATPMTLARWAIEWPPIGGTLPVAAYLGRLVAASAILPARQAAAYARHVRDLALRRGAAAIAHELAAAASEPVTRAERLHDVAAATSELLALHNGHVRRWPEPVDLSAQPPPREWLYGRSIIRRFVSVIAGPGGGGKSTLSLTEALAMAIGRDLIGARPHAPLRVVYWGEDPADELHRRAAAITEHHGLNPDDLAGRLRLASGRHFHIEIARRTPQGPVVDIGFLSSLERWLVRNSVDVLILDPLASAHACEEGANDEMNAVMRALTYLADRAGIAVVVVHHTRKPERGTPGAISADDGRGASAIKDAARSVRVVNAMTADEAERAGIEPQDRWRYFRLDDGKRNLAPAEAAAWYRLCSVELQNSSDEYPDGDSIGVVEQWRWSSIPDDVTVQDLREVQARIATGEWRAHSNSKAWAGIAVADVLGYNLDDAGAKATIKSLLRIWIENGALVTRKRKDEKRREREFIEVGQWADDTLL